MESVPDDFVEQRIEQATAMLRQDRLDEAEGLCKQILVRVPTSIAAMSMMSIIASKQGDVELAIARMQHVVKTDPNSFEGMAWLANMLREHKDFDEAMNKALPEETLRKTWTTAIGQYGALRSQGVLKTEQKAPYDIVIITCAFPFRARPLRPAMNIGTRVPSLDV